MVYVSADEYDIPLSGEQAGKEVSVDNLEQDGAGAQKITDSFCSLLCVLCWGSLFAREG